MYILNEKFKNKSDYNGNLEFKNLDKNTLVKKYLKKGQLKHNPSSVKEWYNSTYNLKNNSNVKALPYKDILVYKVFDTYFNNDKLEKYNGSSMDRIFVGKPEIKHFNNKIHITLYIFNKWIMRFYKTTGMMKTIKSLYTLNNKEFVMLENKPFFKGALLLTGSESNSRLVIFINKLLAKIFYNNKSNKYVGILYTNLTAFFNKVDLSQWGENKNIKRCLYVYIYIINYFFNYIKFPIIINILKRVLLYSLKESKISNIKIMLKILRKTHLKWLKINSLYLFVELVNLFLMIKKILKSIYVMKWFKRNIYYSRYKFSIKNILSVKNILNKLYNSKIEINIINLKYLYLDSNILALTVVRKLKNRKRRVLRVIRMALKLSKKPYINKFYSDLLNINTLDTTLIRKDFNFSINNNIPLNKDLISKPISYKSRIIFFYLKHKIISGMKLQGTGRLTKRLTASRSISKSMGKGSLKNKMSSCNGLSTIVLRGYVKSNLQYVNINSYNRIGAYGIKSWISNY
jgi:hypothetical protein